MAMETKLVGNGTGTAVDTDASGNLKVNLPTTATQAGYAAMVTEVSEPSDPFGRVMREPEATDDYVLRVGTDQILLQSTFGGSATSANAIQQDVWKQTATTMAATAGSPNSGFLRFNSGAVNTAAIGLAYQTYAVYQTYGGFPTYFEFEARVVNANSLANKVIELGAGLITNATSAGLLDGFCFRWTLTGEFRAVLSINGTETLSAPLTIPSDNVVHRYTIVSGQDGLEFWVDNKLQTILLPPTDAVAPSLQPNLPVLMRQYHGVSGPVSVTQLEVSEVFISQGNMQTNKPYSHIMSGMGQHCSNVPYGTAVGQTPAITNSATPAAGAGSNTAALVTGLGGVFQMNAAAGAATDLIATSYQVPALTATQGSKRLYVTGVRVSCINFGAAVATTPTTLQWFLAWGHTAVSLATTDAVGAKAPRRTALGVMSAPVGAAIGTPYSNEIDLAFQTPIVVNPGEFVATVCRQIVGTATASQTILGIVGFGGYWE